MQAHLALAIIRKECSKETEQMATGKQTRFSKGSARPPNRTRQVRTPIANERAAPVRRVSKPPLTEPFHVAVDRQLKSGYETYDAAEKAALGIKKRYPKLQVTVFDAKERRHMLIEPAKLACGNNNRRVRPATNNTVERHWFAVAATRKH